MALAHVADCSSAALATASPTNLAVALTFPDVVAGNALLVTIYQTGGTLRTFSVSDDSGGTWGRLYDYGNGGQEVWTAPNHPATGTVIATVTHSNPSADFWATGGQFSGFGTDVGVAAVDAVLDGAIATAHASSASGVTTASECIAFIAAGSDSILTTTTASSGYAKLPETSSGGLKMFSAWKRFATGATSETGAWTSGTARVARSSILLLVATSAGDPPSSGGTASSLAWFGR